MDDDDLKAREWDYSINTLIDKAEALCIKFVNKVETGRARSVETYADCKGWLEGLKRFNEKHKG